MNIDEIIEKTVSDTIIRLRKIGLIKEYKLSSFQKTEQLLRNYEKLKTVEAETTKKLIGILERELDELRDDYYYEIIPMIYFEGATREQVAEYFDVNYRTITRNKNRLINKLKFVLFSDDVIKELFL